MTFASEEAGISAIARFARSGRGRPDRQVLEGCVAAKKISTNCYEFHQVRPPRDRPFDWGELQPEAPWGSRGWRHAEPSTCEEEPTS